MSTNKKLNAINGVNLNFGFTLIEIIISVTVGAIILTIVYLSFIAGQKIHQKGILNAELAQNGRIALDRISRELRQTGEVTTILSATEPEPPDIEVQFEDGHTDIIQYITYYLSGNELKREVGHYYFASDPDTWVNASAVDGTGTGASYATDIDQTISQYVSEFNVYGELPVITVDLTVSKDNRVIEFTTKDMGRNL